MVPSFFFTSGTGAHQGDTLGRINCFSNNFSNCVFNFANSDGNIRYGAIEIGLVLGNKSIENSISRVGGNPEISLNTQGNPSRLE